MFSKNTTLKFQTAEKERGKSNNKNFGEKNVSHFSLVGWTA